MSDATCGTCKFASDRGTVALRCRRLPPIEDRHWPHVLPSDWCGEHKPTATEESR